MSLNLQWLLRDIRSQLWFTVALYCALGVGVALGAQFLAPLIPATVSSQIGADAVDRVLGIIAASMLAVATFSISTMVQAFASAATGATPRAAQLVVEDRTAQQALATFIGAFVYSLVGLIALSTGAYGSSGRLVLFVATIGVVVLIVVMLLRWIQRLSKLGRIGETIDQVERATLEAIQQRCREPTFGACAAITPPAGLTPVMPERVGYIKRIDVARLSELAEEAGCDIHVALLPGAFVTFERELAGLTRAADDSLLAEMRGCFMIGDQRSYEQDPRFGLIVLSEVASRALSPAVNDPGTAIDVIGTIVRVLSIWSRDAKVEGAELRYPRVYLPRLSADDLLDGAIVPIARDGAAMVEVGIRLQKGLRALVGLGNPDLARAARAQAEQALARAEQALTFAPDRARLKAAADGGG